ncbi:MAG: glycine zipper 2TM domain-containing protein [Candidatus Omnitrophica bacterium]|nr:glycine zipper 2TM domain-containing protein [Candidatus Omnitrophota bacterium]
MKKFFGGGIIALAVIMWFSGCQTPMSGSSYQRDEARKMQTVYYGTVVTVNQVTIEGKAGPAGTITGAAAGAAVGQSIGEGRGKTVATIIGGVAGAVAGGAIEKKVTTKTGLEITVKLEDGRTVAIIQEKTDQDNFKPGDSVQVIYGSDGTARVRPR